MYRNIDESNVGLIINEAWKNTRISVERNDFKLSSEKTIVFKFMWELAKLVDENNLKYDFEYIAYDKIKGNDKFLDLLVWTDSEYKVAFELKFPKKSKNGNSNQTVTRKKIYRDISRVNYLVENNINNIKKGCFLMATNEKPYLNKGNKRENTDLLVHQGYISTGKLNDNYDEILSLPEDFQFMWENITYASGQYSISGKYAWIKPLSISIKRK